MKTITNKQQTSINMQKVYVPVCQAKIIPLYQSALEEWIPLEEAAKLFKSRKCPQGIKPLTLINRITNKKRKTKLPSGSYHTSPTGWWFHKPTLMGLKRSNTTFNNAA